MKTVAVLVALVACALGQGTDPTTNPLTKVVDMLAKIEQEQKDAKTADTETYATYKNWCDDTVANVKASNEDAQAEINRLRASQNEHEASSTDLTGKIAMNNANIEQWEGDKAAAIKVRKHERAEYMAAHRDLAESIAAVGAAIDTLRGQNEKNHDLKGGETAYESQSGGVREIFEDLQTKFQEDLRNKDVAEQEAVAAFGTLMELLNTQLNEENQALNDNSESRADHDKKGAYAKGEAERLQGEVDDDTKYMKDTQANCESAARSFEQRQKVASDELAAIAQALELLRNPETLQGSNNLGRGNSFAQLRAHTTAPNERAIAYLNQMSKKIGSTTLAAVAVSAKADVFGKVTKMIKELIARLEKEAAADSDHHQWCTEELSENEATRNKKTDEVDAATSEQTRLEALIEKKTVEAETLQKEQTQLQEDRKEAVKNRIDEKTENERVIKESAAALKLVQAAVSVLREFYDNQGSGAKASLIKKAERTEPPVIAETSVAAAGSGGVVALMEHIAEELSAQNTDTKVAEKQAAAKHEEFLADNDDTYHKKQLAAEQVARDKAQANEDLTDTNSDLKAGRGELTTALNYFDELKPQCIKTATDPAVRIAKRKEEVAALEQALKILSDEA